METATNFESSKNGDKEMQQAKQLVFFKWKKALDKCKSIEKTHEAQFQVQLEGC